MVTLQRTDNSKSSGASERRNSLVLVILFLVTALGWFVFDRLTKAYFESSALVGQSLAQDYGLFHFRLVHNTGAAWGAFGDSTFVLGLLSIVICIVIVLLFAFFPKLFGRSITMFETIALALICAGGLGNAFDRFVFGYVIDFIDLSFIDFPVFNIADIGVTCGFVAFFIFMFYFSRGDSSPKQETSEVDHA